MAGNRVVITGQGAFNALGRTASETMSAMREGRSGIGALDFPDVDRLMIQIGAQIRGYTPGDHFGRQELALYDPFTQFALLAGREAAAQAGLEIDEALAERAGVVLGTSGGGLQTQDENYRLVYQEGKNRVHPFVVPRLMNNAAASHLSMALNLKGPTYTVATACASSNHAMGQAMGLIRSGQADVVLTGGSESMLCFGGIKAWEGLRVMSRDACRPFSLNRNGMVQGEGAAVFVFESLEHATGAGCDHPRRGARLRDDLRRLRHRDAEPRRGGAGDARGAARRRAAGRRRRLHQRARHRHHRQRPHRDARRCGRSSGRTPTG